LVGDATPSEVFYPLVEVVVILVLVPSGYDDKEAEQVLCTCVLRTSVLADIDMTGQWLLEQSLWRMGFWCRCSLAMVSWKERQA
jgi:hypothetical protein